MGEELSPLPKGETMSKDIFTDMIVQELREKQSWDLDKKIEYSKEKIVEFVEHCGGIDKTYISFSGGKDSCVLLHLVRSVYPQAQGVFFDTGLEYPEVVEYVKEIDNIEVRKPRKSFPQVAREFGLPAVSKESANYIYEIRTSNSDKLIDKRLNYRRAYSLPRKWIHFTDPEFFEPKVSNKCCTYFKKMPSEDYVKETGRYPFVGTIADESLLRLNSWVKYSCNMYTKDKTQSRPLSIWTEEDIWAYIKKYDIKLCKIYDMGHDRTGCYLCTYGSHLEDRDRGTNKFEMLKEQHPKHYQSLKKLGIRDVLLNMQVPIRNDEEYMKDLKAKRLELKEWYQAIKDGIAEDGEDSKYYKYRKYFEPTEKQKKNPSIKSGAKHMY